MAVYPDKLEKISEASTGISTSTIRKHVQDMENAHVAGISKPDGTGENEIYPLSEFIEKLADAVVDTKEDLIAALESSSSTSDNRYGTNVTTIYVAKDITLDTAITLGKDKVIIGTSAILKLDNNLTIDNNSLYSYCKIEVSATRTITGTGTVWFKDILCPDTANFQPFTATNVSSKTYERCVKKSDYYTEITPNGWTKKFIDNTFPYKNIYDTLQSLNEAIADLRNDVNHLKDTGGEGKYVYGVSIDSDGKLSLVCHDVKTDFNNVPTGSVSYDLATRQAIKAYVDALRNDINNIANGGDGKYISRINVENDGKIVCETHSVEHNIATRKISEDYAVPTTKATQDFVDHKVDNLDEGGDGYYISRIKKESDNTLKSYTKTLDLVITDNDASSEDYSLATSKAVVEFVNRKLAQAYKPKGNAYITESNGIAKLHIGDSASGAAITPSADKLGFVYNVINAGNADGSEKEYTFKDANDTSYSIWISANEDVGIVDVGTSANPLYRFNDFGGKINLENFYTKAEVDAMSANIQEGSFIYFRTTPADPPNQPRPLIVINARAPGVYNATTQIEGQVIITPSSSPSRMLVGLKPDAAGSSVVNYGILPPVPATNKQGHVLKVTDNNGSVAWEEVDSNISYLLAHASAAISSGTNLNKDIVAEAQFPSANPAVYIDSGTIKLKSGSFIVHAFIEVANTVANMDAYVYNFNIFGAAINASPYITVSWNNSYEHTEVYEISYLTRSSSDGTTLLLNTNALSINSNLSIKVKYIQVYDLMV